MTKKKAPQKELTPYKYETPLPFPVFTEVPLVLEERERLRVLFSDPVFQKALRNAHARMPDKNPPGIGVVPTEHALLIANNRLHELRGWEMFQGALFMQAEEKVPRVQKTLIETYPNE
jgi:hypothetical protein